ncbi:unnamed protein product, partial [Hapterophycus canaliculatus]
QGAKIKLPRKGRGGKTGKVLGSVTSRIDGDSGHGGDQDQDQGGVFRGLGEGLVLRAADAAESHGYRALFSADEDGALSAADPFAGQINLSVQTASAAESDPEPSLVDRLVEPYRGRPQLKGMRVRSKPAGAGSEYSPTRPSAGDRQQGVAHDGDGDDEPLATPDRRGRTKTKSSTSAFSPKLDEAQGMHLSAQTFLSCGKKKRKSTS